MKFPPIPIFSTSVRGETRWMSGNCSVRTKERVCGDVIWQAWPEGILWNAHLDYETGLSPRWRIYIRVDR
jgi:hypothetical protein